MVKRGVLRIIVSVLTICLLISIHDLREVSAEHGEVDGFERRNLVDSGKNKGIPIMVTGGKSIFLLVDGKRHHIPDFDTFTNMGFGMGDVKYITQEEMDSYPIGTEEGTISDTQLIAEESMCPCESASRKSDQIEANRATTPHNICIVKNRAMEDLFTNYYDILKLKKHLHFYVISEDMSRKSEEISRWKMYNETLARLSYSASSEYNITDAVDIAAIVDEEEDETTDSQSAEAATKEAVPIKSINYDSDVDKYPSPYFDKPGDDKRYSGKRRRLKGSNVQYSSQTKTYTRKRRLRQLEEAEKTKKSLSTKCDVTIDIMSDNFEFASHVCPGICRPIPRALVHMDLLSPEPLHPELDLTCRCVKT